LQEKRSTNLIRPEPVERNYRIALGRAVRIVLERQEIHQPLYVERVAANEPASQVMHEREERRSVRDALRAGSQVRSVLPEVLCERVGGRLAAPGRREERRAQCILNVHDIQLIVEPCRRISLCIAPSRALATTLRR
jgi:hypothetical protein